MSLWWGNEDAERLTLHEVMASERAARTRRLEEAQGMECHIKPDR
jgi:hypothetical protein